jgi:hypothetical protein
MKLWRWFLALWNGRTSKSQEKCRAQRLRLFHACTIVNSPPPNDVIGDGEFVIVTPSKEPKWALFKCPCGCGHVITLSLVSSRTPHWRVRLEAGLYPTLYPSVQQLNGCHSHFWVKSGQIDWCEDTGKPYCS